MIAQYKQRLLPYQVIGCPFLKGNKIEKEYDSKRDRDIETYLNIEVYVY